MQSDELKSAPMRGIPAPGTVGSLRKNGRLILIERVSRHAVTVISLPDQEIDSGRDPWDAQLATRPPRAVDVSPFIDLDVVDPATLSEAQRAFVNLRRAWIGLPPVDRTIDQTPADSTGQETGQKPVDAAPPHDTPPPPPEPSETPTPGAKRGRLSRSTVLGLGTRDKTLTPREEIILTTVAEREDHSVAAIIEIVKRHEAFAKSRSPYNLAWGTIKRLVKRGVLTT